MITLFKIVDVKLVGKVGVKTGSKTVKAAFFLSCAHSEFPYLVIEVFVIYFNLKI